MNKEDEFENLKQDLLLNIEEYAKQLRELSYIDIEDMHKNTELTHAYGAFIIAHMHYRKLVNNVIDYNFKKPFDRSAN